MNQGFVRAALLGIFYVGVAGVMVGQLHAHPVSLAAVLVAILIYFLVSRSRRPGWGHRAKEIVYGSLLSFCLGFLSEWIGTEQRWWIYRYFESGAFKFPPWVPIAWAGAYVIFFRIEYELFSVTKNFFLRALGVIALFCILPPLGEIIAIAHGTWHYTFQPQWLGMPIQAVLLIAFVHLLNFSIVTGVQKKKRAVA